MIIMMPAIKDSSMRSVQLLHQPLGGQVGNYLKGCLEGLKYNKLVIVVAFAKNSGVLRLKKSFEAFRKSGGEIEVYVGIDLDGTSFEALVSLLKTTDKLTVVHLESGQTFHPKIFCFSSDKDCTLIVGSNNLTSGGLWTNFEASLILTEEDNAEKSDAQKDLDDFIKQLEATSDICFEIKDEVDIDDLLAEGYISKEAKSRIARNARIYREAGRPSKFAKKLEADLPRIEYFIMDMNEEDKLQPHKKIESNEDAPPALVEEDSSIIWLETRKMTGGSRNILDLSKTAAVIKGDPTTTQFSMGESDLMEGGVRFFGVDPSDISTVKDIVINYDGIDYDGNTIKYPEGDRANGTWRLQIKGRAEDSARITEALGPEYLVNKVITFTRIDDGYYFMAVFDADDMKEFQEVSKVVAYNGSSRNSRLLGLL